MNCKSLALIAAFCVVPLFTVGCGEDPVSGSPAFEMTGTWSGTYADATYNCPDTKLVVTASAFNMYLLDFYDVTDTLAHKNGTWVRESNKVILSYSEGGLDTLILTEEISIDKLECADPEILFYKIR